MATIAKSFTAVGNGDGTLVQNKQKFSYSVSGTFVATAILEKSEDGGLTYIPLATKSAAASDTLVHESASNSAALVRFRCSAFTSGTMVTSINSEPVVSSVIQLPAGVLSKAGTTSGFVVAAGDNISLATCPASKTASTLVVPVVGLKVGQVITGFYLVGQIESGGNAATVDANLRKGKAAAADVADSSIASITQVSVTADAVMSASNAGKTGLSQVVQADENYYVLITATTAASTDIALQSVNVLVSESI